MEYANLPEFSTLLMERTALTLPRAVQLFDAISCSKSYKLLGLQRSSVNGEINELLIVDMASDAIPTRNKVDILYPERLGILVAAKELSIPQVFPLRGDFPSVPHRNSPLPGFPPDLCLYFEPIRAVLRTWTPAKFLKRIEWWMQGTANGTLHATDQPAERLFFLARHELVLPFDFHEGIKAGKMFSLGQGIARPDGSITLSCHVTNTTERQNKNNIEFSFIHLQLSSVVNSIIEQSPFTLGGLHDLFMVKGVELQENLKQEIKPLVSNEGVSTQTNSKYTVLLLSIPVMRANDGEVEFLESRAFFIGQNVFKLGELLGVFLQHEGTYFKDVSIGEEKVADVKWRDLAIEGIEVLFQNSGKDARKQSGIKDEGPTGALIGVGSLGSAIHELWVRSGWGVWTVVDKDHIKPHNIVRHTAVFSQIGVPKSHAVIQFAADINVGGMQHTGIVADAIESKEENFCNVVKKSQLVVDATTTLDYPRKASVNRSWARHASVFITPHGRDSVMLIEDIERKMTLLTLEAQYYRAILSNAWGEQHLIGNMGTYWSGAGCRDISLSLPYSRVLSHATNHAEQLMLMSKQEDSMIRVWVRDPDTASVAVHTIPVMSEVKHELGPFSGYLDEGVNIKLRQLRAATLPKETGGILLGYWDLNIKAVVIVDVLPAPEDSKSEMDSFIRGTQGLVAAVNEISRLTAGVVGYVGEWHSHPPGVRATPSNDDLFQLASLATVMALDGLPVVSLIVGADEIRLMLGQTI